MVGRAEVTPADRTFSMEDEDMMIDIRIWRRTSAAGLVLCMLGGCGGGGSSDEPVAGPARVAAGSTEAAAVKAGPWDAHPVQSWNQAALETVRGLSLSDAQAARLYAMVNVALYDAVNGIDSQTDVRRQPALVPARGVSARAHAGAAAAAAGHALLVRAHPERAALYDARLAADLAAIADGAAKQEGQAWGAEVGSAVHALRQNDGSTPNETQPGGTGPGVFRADWSGVQFRRLAPFVLADPARYAGFVPPALTSAAYASAFNEVKLLGSAAVDDPLAMQTFQFWAGGSGSAQPAGEWIKLALALSREHALGLPESTRLMALLGMALSDVVAPTFRIKYDTHAWRPATAIREADLDGNPDTQADPAWAPRAGGIGSSPEAVSGHSAFAGAASTVLRGYFCSDRIAFVLQTDSATGGARRYTSFSEAEAEAGRSRVGAGLHFEFSNAAGQATGRGVGDEVLAKALLRSHGLTHHGSCPR